MFVLKWLHNKKLLKILENLSSAEAYSVYLHLRLFLLLGKGDWNRVILMRLIPGRPDKFKPGNIRKEFLLDLSFLVDQMDPSKLLECDKNNEQLEVLSTKLRGDYQAEI